MKKTREDDLINIGIIGVGGYGAVHLESVRVCEKEGLCRLKAAVIRVQEMEILKEREKELKEAGVAIYRTHREMLEAGQGSLDLVTIPAGIDQHEPLSIDALGAGYSVLCEKPVAGSMAGARRMMKARDEAGKTLAIGYQYIASPSMQRIKALAVGMHLGALRSAKAFVSWPRTDRYYGRNYWSGKLYVDGRPIFDSPVQNATSHFLNNMLYVAGRTPGESAAPAEVYGENLKASAIESPDTQFIRIRTETKVEIIFFVTHATGTLVNPVTEFLFEKGKVLWEQGGRTRVFKGSKDAYELEEEFDDGGVQIKDGMFRDVIDALRTGRPPRANIDNSWQHTMSVELLFKSCPVTAIAPEHVEVFEVDGDLYGAIDARASKKPRQTAIKGIDAVLEAMFREGKSFYEAGAPWAVKGTIVRA
jgi:predicted dehydrogenase